MIERAYGRVGLLGNPSDIYGGKCISFTFDKFAEVEINQSERLSIFNKGVIEKSLDYNGNHDLIKATIRRLKLNDERLEIKYQTNIPFGSGLSGSTAIVIAAMNALNKMFNLNFDKYKIAEEALKVETEELKIAAGFQDRYVVSFGGLVYMDFTGKEFMREDDPYGKIEKLNVKEIPCFLALSGVSKKATVHNSLRDRFLSNEIERNKIKTQMDKIANLAVEGKEAILKEDWLKVGELMNKNTELRNVISPISEKENSMIKEALEFGALGAKIAGSGGCIVVLSEDEKVFEKMSENYECFKPKIIIC